MGQIVNRRRCIFANGHDYVEIGGVKWATMNIGANSITDYGLFFQWGDTQGYTASQVGSGTGKKYFGWADYKFNPSGDGATFSKYNLTDGLVTLEASDDAVHAAWGGNWRTPTKDEFIALRDAIDYIDANGNTITATNKLTTLNGVKGMYIADKNDHSKRLFFPACGLCDNGSVSNVGSQVRYWSSSLDSSTIYYAYNLRFYNGEGNWSYRTRRFYGFSLRGVLDS